MGLMVKSWIWDPIIGWLTEENELSGAPMCDYETLSHEVRPADVILVEGRSRVADVIRSITQSPWSHSMLCIGRLHDVDSPGLREKIRNSYQGPTNVPLVVEALMGQGTIISPLHNYRRDHLRICRPRDLSHSHGQEIIAHALSKLGMEYDIRQILDLLRFMFPYGLLPRRWRSSLFQHNAGQPTRTVCSTMLAEAFTSVKFPILPVVREHENGGLQFYRRNPRLYTPRDFDYSPYFDIVKYPFWGKNAPAKYQQVVWDRGSNVYNSEEEVRAMEAEFQEV